MQAKLCCDNIGELANGTARGTIDACIRHALGDLDDRGEDGKAREVIVKLAFQKADSGLITATVGAETKIPAYRTAGTAGRLRAQDRNNPACMLFQTADMTDPDQRTFDDLTGGAGLQPGEIPPGP